MGKLRMPSFTEAIILVMVIIIATLLGCGGCKMNAKDKRIAKLEAENLRLKADCDGKIDTGTRHEREDGYPYTPVPTPPVSKSEPSSYSYPLVRYIPKEVVKWKTKYVDKYIVSEEPVSISKEEYSRAESQVTGDSCKRFYDTTFYNDPSPSKYGTIFIKDKVTQNKIVERTVTTDFEVKTQTITQTVEQRRRVLYFGPTLIGGASKYINDVGAGFTYKTKQDVLYEAALLSDFKGNKQVQVGFKVKLGFRK